MTVPLIVLAALSLLGGLLDLPWWHSGISAPLSWLEPVLGLHQHVPNGSVATRLLLSIADALIAIGGVAAGWRLWRKSAEQPALEPAVLRHAWYIDESYDSYIAKPSIVFAKFASVFDRQVIDGAVVGIASVTRRVGTGLRKIQTGFVRQYALGIVFGALLLLAFMLVKAW
jgi:NADH-quinone oxidoreductase subunit L